MTYKTSSPNQRVIGRLAPSPTGSLHTGNLCTFLFTWVHARATSGRLILRIEDLDPPRVVEDSEAGIVEDLRWLGIDWDDGPDVGGIHAPYRQSERSALYEHALERLVQKNLAYPCDCSRRDIEEALSAPHVQFDPRTRYPGTCRPDDPSNLTEVLGEALTNETLSANETVHAWRMQAEGIITVHDELAGTMTHDLREEPGDFVIRRRDGLWAYQLAVVVDDIAMGVTDVIRGRDLFSSTPRQFALYDALGAARPRTWHVPLVVDNDGARLSKRGEAPSRQELEVAGWTPAKFRGACAKRWGWSDESCPLSAEALVELWDPTAAELRSETIHIPIP